MKVLLVGGGSGGHITPLLAVAHSLRKAQPDAKIFYALEKGSKFDDMPRGSKDIDSVYTVRTGKLRRYHGDSLFRRLIDVPTNLKNLRDGFYVVVGYFQARRLLKKLQPDVVFIKGSSVGVPIGKACTRLGIPYFTHDSDSVASLTNRIIAKHAVYHATGMPLEFYSHADKSMRYTGIPLSAQYKLVDSTQKERYRRQLGVPADALVITVTGGSLGAQRLNDSFRAIAESLLDNFPKLHILHQTGVSEPLYANLSASLQERVREVAFTDELAALTGAADIVLSRAGATTIAELAVQAKAAVFVPGSQLTGGQQTQNAKYLAKHHAAIIVPDTEDGDPTLEKVLRDLLRSDDGRRTLAKNIGKLAKADAAEALTAIIEEIAKQSK